MTRTRRRLRTFLMAAALLTCFAAGPAYGGALTYGGDEDTARSRAGFESEAPVLRIGVSAESGSRIFGGKGAQSGYVSDYLKRLADYARIRDGREISFRFVSVPTTQEMERMAAQGELELFEFTGCEEGGSLEGYSEAFLQDSFFVGEPVGENQYTLCTLPEDTDLFFEDIEGLEGAAIGLIKGQGVRLLDAYAKEKGFSYTPILYGSEADVEKALETGEADAAVIDTGDSSIRRVIAYLGKTKMYLGACGEEGASLVAYLNELQTTLYNYEPFYDSTLAERHYADHGELYEAYTRKEEDYIRSMGTVRVAVCRDDEPNSYYDEKAGAYKGTCVELLNLIGKHSRLKFEYIPADTRDECLLAVREGKADLALGLYNLEYLAKKWELSFSDPLMTKYIAAIGKSGSATKSDYAQTVGLTMDQAEEWLAYIREYFPKWDERFYTSEKKCFEAVENGTVNIALLDGNSIQSSKLYSRYKNVGMISSLSRQVDIVLGLPDTKPAILKNIINKSVRSLSSSEVISCQMDNAMGYSQDPWEVLREYLPYLLFGLLCFFLLAAAVLLVSEHRKRYAQQKEAFFSNMSHEIRTPLNGIVGMTAIAQKNMGDMDRVKDCLDKIEYSCGHLMTIVNDILDLSKLEKKKMQIANERMDLRELLNAVHTIYAMQSSVSGVDYDTRISDLSDGQVYGDYTRLSQVLMNLLSNAVKFTPPGKKVRLEVTQKTRGGERSDYLFQVRDEGVGIPKENLSKIFNAYEQQGAKTAGKYGGSGLGLPISRKLVELMGGRLCVASVLGEGSTFYFTLTLRRAPQEVGVQEKRAGEADAIPDLSGRRVLIAEDNEINREIICELVRGCGCEADAVENGEEAVKRFAGSGPGVYALILMDIQMPVMNGYEAVRAIRRMEREDGRTIYIAAMTADAFPEDIKRAKEAGMNSHLSKPIELPQLYKVLTEAALESRGEGEQDEA